MTWYHVNPDGSYHEVTIEETGGNIFQPIEERQLALDEVAPGITVSTVFLGIDHRFRLNGDDEPPVLWETLVMGGDPSINQQMWRYTSQADAIAGHAAAIAWVNDRLDHGPLSDDGLGRVAYEADSRGWTTTESWESISRVKQARYRRIGRAVADHVRTIGD